jgi:hypothetical protein
MSGAHHSGSANGLRWRLGRAPHKRVGLEMNSMEQRSIEEELREKIYYLEERIEALEARTEKLPRNAWVIL